MSLADALAALVVIGLTAYAVLAGADFGTGIWEVFAGRRRAEVRHAVEGSMAPVWEANHVWLIFVLVLSWTCFPVAFGSVASTLYIPLSAAAVGIILRGAAFATRGAGGRGGRAGAWYGALFAGSSLLTPFFLAAAIGGIASGRVPEGNAQGDALTSWWNPVSVLAGVLAVVTGAHLAAVYLAADARRHGDAGLEEWFRRRGVVSGVVAGAVALAGLFVVNDDAPDLFDGLTGGWALVFVIVSGLAGAATIGLLLARRLGPARVAGALSVAAVVWGWAAAQAPYILPESLTVEEAAATRPTLVAVLVACGLGMLVLVPSLVYLYRLVLSGRLDKDPVPGSGRPLP
ncbi:MAG: cytochrome d ubiquinol oxidase subunit II [Thermoleophilia bacterium]